MNAVRRFAAAGLACLLLAACSGDKPATSQDKADLLKKEADEQKRMHDREVHNR